MPRSPRKNKIIYFEELIPSQKMELDITDDDSWFDKRLQPMHRKKKHPAKHTTNSTPPKALPTPKMSLTLHFD